MITEEWRKKDISVHVRNFIMHTQCLPLAIFFLPTALAHQYRQWPNAIKTLLISFIQTTVFYDISRSWKNTQLLDKCSAYGICWLLFRANRFMSEFEFPMFNIQCVNNPNLNILWDRKRLGKRMSQKLRICAADRVGLGCRMSCETWWGRYILLHLHLEVSEDNKKNISGGSGKDKSPCARFQALKQLYWLKKKRNLAYAVKEFKDTLGFCFWTQNPILLQIAYLETALNLCPEKWLCCRKA